MQGLRRFTFPIGWRNWNGKLANAALVGFGVAPYDVVLVKNKSS